MLYDVFRYFVDAFVIGVGFMLGITVVLWALGGSIDDSR